jgi:hypothetical protein
VVARFTEPATTAAAGLAVGYAIVVWVSGVIDGYTAEETAASAGGRSQMVALIARNRWFWIPPIYAVALLLVVVVTHVHGADAAQFMYRNF